MMTSPILSMWHPAVTISIQVWLLTNELRDSSESIKHSFTIKILVSLINWLLIDILRTRQVGSKNSLWLFTVTVCHRKVPWQFATESWQYVVRKWRKFNSTSQACRLRDRVETESKERLNYRSVSWYYVRRGMRRGVGGDCSRPKGSQSLARPSRSNSVLYLR